MTRRLERYEDDLAHLRSNGSRVAVGLLALALVALPWWLPGYAYDATLLLVYATVAVGLGLLVGFTGQVSLGHAGFLAAGAYATALLHGAGVPFLLALVAAALVGAALGVLIGLPALRLEGPYLAIATLGFGLAVQQVLNNWDLAGASAGMLADRPAWAGYDDAPYYLLCLAVLALVTWMALNLERSHLGRAMKAVRDADLAAQASGIDLARVKTLAFALSAAATALAGGLYGGLVGYLTPEGFNLLLSIKFLLMVVAGGLGSLQGALLGAALVVVLDTLLARTLNLSQLLFGLVVIALMMLEPRGLWGRWQVVRRWWRSWPL